VTTVLKSLPWVEKDSIKPDIGKQQVTFAVKDKQSFKLEEVRKAIDGQTEYRVGRVISGP
jgi:hypothetical protein